jgi:hypothetical protein
MQNEGPKVSFWIGNGILAVAMVLLLFMGRLWEQMGAAVMGLWIALVIGGVYMLMKDNG